MRISRIRVENHRSIPDLDIKVNNHLALIGPNESGKTRFLELLNSILSKSKSQLTYELNSNNPIRDINNPLVAEVALADLTSAEITTLGKLQEPVNDDSERLELRLRTEVQEKLGEISYKRVFTKPGLGKGLNSGIDFESLSEEQRDCIKWAYLPSNRQPDKVIGQTRSSVVQNLLKKITLGDARPEIEKVISSLHEEIVGYKSTEEVLEKIAIVFEELFSREVSKSDVSIKLSTIDETSLLGSFGIYLQDNSSSTTSNKYSNRSLRDQSDGIKAMATVVIQLLQFDLEDNTILAVDEPEIHLHPRAQVRFANWLTSTKGQRIIVTHSSAVLEAFSPLDVVALNPAGKCKQLPENILEEDSKLLLHRWNSAALEPLTSRLVILVEGLTDRILLESFAKALGCDFNQLDVSIIPADGVKNFPTLIKFYGEEGFNIPLIGLLDKDKNELSSDVRDLARSINISEELSIEDTEREMKKHGFWLAELNLEEECIKALTVLKHASYLLESKLFSGPDKNYLEGCTQFESDINIESYKDWCLNKRRKPYIAIALERSLKLLSKVEAKSVAENFTLIGEIVEAVKVKVNEI